MCIDALHRRESCGGHFRAESQTDDGEALRARRRVRVRRGVGVRQSDGDRNGEPEPVLHKEELVYEYVELKQRSYK